ncbi:hypothetical protein Tco_0540958 [Tanacetum coccineum]
MHKSIQGRFEGPLNWIFKRKSWSIGKVPLEIMIRDPPLTRKENLNFMIVKFDSPYNMLLGRKTMHKWNRWFPPLPGPQIPAPPEGIWLEFSTHESDDKVREGIKKVRETPSASKKGVFSCTTAEEKVVVNNKYPKQTVAIGKQLPKHFKERLRDLLRANADVFA